MSAAVAVGERVSGDVRSAVQADWGTRGSSQFRLSFDIGTDADTEADVVVCDAASAQLELSYWLP
jgi:hypothetical protein